MKKDVDILLVNPWIYDFAAYDFWAKPLGLLRLGGKLRSLGYKIGLVDALDRFHPQISSKLRSGVFGTGHFFRQPLPKPSFFKDIPRRFARYGLPREIFIQELEKFNPPQLIMITSLMTYWYPGVIETVRIIKKCFPKVPVMLGGIYATLCYKHALANVETDLICRGTDENKILKIIQKMVRPSGKKISHSFPVFDLQRNISYIVIATSWGCPFRCPYCASHLLRPSFKPRSPYKILKEIEFWYSRYGVKDFVFYDDALLVNFSKHLAIILERVLSKGWNIRFHTPNALHLRMITSQVAKFLYRSGFKTLRFGLETADANRRASLDQKVHLEEFVQAISYLREAGFIPSQLGVYLLWGLPNQSFQEVKESAEYVVRHKAMPYLAEFSPIPGTKLFKEAVISSRYPLEEDPLFQNNSCFPCLSSPDWEAIEEVKRFVRNLRKKIFKIKVSNKGIDNKS